MWSIIQHGKAVPVFVIPIPYNHAIPVPLPYTWKPNSQHWKTEEQSVFSRYKNLRPSTSSHSASRPSPHYKHPSHPDRSKLHVWLSTWQPSRHQQTRSKMLMQKSIFQFSCYSKLNISIRRLIFLSLYPVYVSTPPDSNNRHSSVEHLFPNYEGCFLRNASAESFRSYPMQPGRQEKKVKP